MIDKFDVYAIVKICTGEKNFVCKNELLEFFAVLPLA